MAICSDERKGRSVVPVEKEYAECSSRGGSYDGSAKSES